MTAPLRIDVLTLFPRMFDSPFAESIVARARQAGRLVLEVHDIRLHATDKHHVADDTPYGGGAGMVLKPEPLTRAIRAARGGDGHVVLLSAQGRLFDQAAARRLASVVHLVLVCGHYEGVDERVVESDVDEELSIGDYVLTGGELAAMVVIDAVTRLVPDVIDAESLAHESHTDGLLEGPQYTRPPEFEGRRVPPVLVSGDHGAIAKWRRAESIRRTAERRPDLLGDAKLTPAERARLPRAPARRASVNDADLVEAYRSGVGSYRIAARFGISPATVRVRLRAAGVRLRAARSVQRGPSAAEVARMRATGLTVRQLATHFGVSHVTILARLKRAKR
jgi:tRNA (guanine37-N1)-methyltransferase